MKFIQQLLSKPRRQAVPIPATSDDIKQLDMRALPLFTADKLLPLIGSDPKLHDLFRIIGISEGHFDLLYRRPILTFAEAVQLAPASENNHHCGPGGLLKHTLEVLQVALHVRKAYQLPLGGSPEDMAREEHHWTYGVFIACLLHDIGKVLTRFQLVLNMPDGSRQLWNPHSIPIYETGADSYGIVFQECSYKAHQRMGVTLYGSLIPQPARAWLAQHSDVMAQTLASIWGDPYESQVIGEIVSIADRESTAKNTDITNAELRFPGAKDSLADRLVQKLRQLLSDGAIKINKVGAMGWVAGEDVYLVCRPLAELLIKSFEDVGAEGIPSDPLRIYDVLQEHGFALPTPDEKAVWKIQVSDTSKKFNQAFTCLKFKTRRLWLPVRLPQSFEGVIKEIATDAVDPVPDAVVNAPVENAIAVEAAPKITSRSYAPEETVTSVDPEYEPEPETLPALLVNETGEDDISSLLSDWNEAEAVKEDVPADTEIEELSISQTEHSPEGHAEVSESENSADPMGPTESIATADWNEDVANAFWTWVCEGILSKTLATNNTRASVHFVEEGVFLVSPRIFKHYCKHALLGESSYSKLQKRFQRMKLHKKTTLTHLNVHSYMVDTGSRTARLNGWVIAYDKIFPAGADLPQLNKFLRPSD